MSEIRLIILGLIALALVTITQKEHVDKGMVRLLPYHVISAD